MVRSGCLDGDFVDNLGGPKTFGKPEKKSNESYNDYHGSSFIWHCCGIQRCYPSQYRRIRTARDELLSEIVSMKPVSRQNYAPSNSLKILPTHYCDHTNHQVSLPET